MFGIQCVGVHTQRQRHQEILFSKFCSKRMSHQDSATSQCEMTRNCILVVGLPCKDWYYSIHWHVFSLHYLHTNSFPILLILLSSCNLLKCKGFVTLLKQVGISLCCRIFKFESFHLTERRERPCGYLFIIFTTGGTLQYFFQFSCSLINLKRTRKQFLLQQMQLSKS